MKYFVDNTALKNFVYDFSKKIIKNFKPTATAFNKNNKTNIIFPEDKIVSI